MLSHEENELLCRVGPGTPMGNLMRQYWMPALLSRELPEPGCRPVRTLLLGEKLVAFRDGEGRVGLLDHLCPHRKASLCLGRNEPEGIRCVYHGWQFDVEGRCLDMPSEPPESTFKDRLRAKAYPCVERAGLVWTYLGPRETPPPLPAFEWLDAPVEQVTANAYAFRCNWFQAFEGDLDPVHPGFLHFGHARPEDAPDGSFFQYAIEDRAPRHHVVDTDYGVTLGAERQGSADESFWWILHFLFPFYGMTPAGQLGAKAATLTKVPMDDHHTLVFQTGLAQSYSVDDDSARRQAARNYYAEHQVQGRHGWYDRFAWVENEENDYGLDYELQRSGQSYTGMPGFVLQDVAICESMGPIVDRSDEHLAASDVMMIRMRRRLIAAARALAEHGTVPPGVDDPEVYLQRSGGVMLPKGADWWAETAELRRGGGTLAAPNPALTGGL